MIRGFPDDESLERLKFSEESVEHIWYSSSGEVVETTKTQTLTNKTLTSPSINAPTINSVAVLGEVVETTKTQTLINKTLTTPTISDLNHTAQESIEIVEYT